MPDEKRNHSSDISGLLAIAASLRFDGGERDQQKWVSVLRPVALQLKEGRMI
jgi:hypothetical protein